jgi:hypothetical protein
MSESKHTDSVDEIMQLARDLATDTANHYPRERVEGCRSRLREAIRALVESRDQAARQVAAVQSWIQERWSVCRNLDEVTHDRDALCEQVQRLEAIIKASPETYLFVEDDDTWHGQQFCWFCQGEMASQQVNHKDDCIWNKARLTKGTHD